MAAKSLDFVYLDDGQVDSLDLKPWPFSQLDDGQVDSLEFLLDSKLYLIYTLQSKVYITGNQDK